MAKEKWFKVSFASKEGSAFVKAESEESAIERAESGRGVGVEETDDYRSFVDFVEEATGACYEEEDFEKLEKEWKEKKVKA